MRQPDSVAGIDDAQQQIFTVRKYGCKNDMRQTLQVFFSIAVLGL
jgi:hypothetical protein